MKGFNLEYIRSLNKIKIFKSSKKSGVEKIFSAYLPDGFDLNLAVNANSLLGNYNITNNVWLQMALNLMGQSTAIDISRKMICTGSEPLKFKVTCALLLTDSYAKDIADPLNNLMKYFLPSRGNIITDFKDRLNTFVENKKQETIKEQHAEGVTSGTGGIWDLINKSINFVNSYIGDVYELKQPEGVDAETSLIIHFGNHYKFEDCYISNIGVKMPKFLVEDGYPDHVIITLDIETLRTATIQNVKF